MKTILHTDQEKFISIRQESFTIKTSLNITHGINRMKKMKHIHKILIDAEKAAVKNQPPFKIINDERPPHRNALCGEHPATVILKDGHVKDWL